MPKLLARVPAPKGETNARLLGPDPHRVDTGLAPHIVRQALVCRADPTECRRRSSCLVRLSGWGGCLGRVGPEAVEGDGCEAVAEGEGVGACVEEGTGFELGAEFVA